MEREFKNGDLVFFTENPFLYPEEWDIVKDLQVEIRELEGGYFKFGLSGYKRGDKPYSASINWVQHVE